MYVLEKMDDSFSFTKFAYFQDQISRHISN